MRCLDTMQISGAHLCLGEKAIYMCDNCNGNECDGCKEIPKPEFNLQKPNQRMEYKRVYQGVEEYSGIMDIVKTKEFLFGLGAGLLLGAFLFRK